MKHEVSSQPAAAPGGIRTLDVYKVALELAGLMHEPLGRMRLHNRELEDQARRALISLVLNIAEAMGKAGSSKREQARFYSIARGSCFELQATLQLCRVWKWLDQGSLEATEALLDRLRAMLHRLIARAG